jgi:hypothetical protein
MRKRKTTKEIIELFQKDSMHILFKPLDYNKFVYLDSDNEDISIIIIGLDGCIFKVLREVYFSEVRE